MGSGPLAAWFTPCNACPAGRSSRRFTAVCARAAPERRRRPIRFSNRADRPLAGVDSQAWRNNMAYDRYDTRDAPRDERSRWSDDGNRERGWDRDRGRGSEDRGFFERAGDEIASWFGDDDAERRRRSDQMRDQREGSGGSSGEYRNEDRGYGRDFDRDRSSTRGRGD